MCANIPKFFISCMFLSVLLTKKVGCSLTTTPHRKQQETYKNYLLTPKAVVGINLAELHPCIVG